jgi:hypothetical protein
MRDDITSVLWDFKKEKIPTLPHDFVVKRVLAYGTIALILKTIQEDSIEYVRATFDALRPTAISKKKYHYIKNFLLK